jgi:hypothetical protein
LDRNQIQNLMMMNKSNEQQQSRSSSIASETRRLISNESQIQQKKIVRDSSTGQSHKLIQDNTNQQRMSYKQPIIGSTTSTHRDNSPIYSMPSLSIQQRNNDFNHRTVSSPSAAVSAAAPSSSSRLLSGHISESYGGGERFDRLARIESSTTTTSASSLHNNRNQTERYDKFANRLNNYGLLQNRTIGMNDDDLLTQVPQPISTSTLIRNRAPLHSSTASSSSSSNRPNDSILKPKLLASNSISSSTSSMVFTKRAEQSSKTKTTTLMNETRKKEDVTAVGQNQSINFKYLGFVLIVTVIFYTIFMHLQSNPVNPID